MARHANEAVDKAGKTEGRSNPLLKRTKYLWLRNEESLTELQVETKRNLTRQRLKTGRACRMREVLQDIYTDSRTPSEAWVRLHRLCSWMMHSRLEPMKDFARMIRRHFAEIVAYFEHPYTNAVLEGADSVIQNVKRRARGFRNMDYFATMIYLTCGRLDLKAVTTTPDHHPPQTANSLNLLSLPRLRGQRTPRPEDVSFAREPAQSMRYGLKTRSVTGIWSISMVP